MVLYRYMLWYEKLQKKMKKLVDLFYQFNSIKKGRLPFKSHVEDKCYRKK